MLYIFNKTIPENTNIIYALTFLYGINIYQSKKICKNIGINPQITVNKLKNNHVNRLIIYINKNIKIEQFLKKDKKDKINNLLEIKNNRGIRLSQGLPVRGQRTHTNAKNAKKFKNIFIQKENLRYKVINKFKKNFSKKKK